MVVSNGGAALRAFFLSGSLLLLAACGGGGGSGTPSPEPPAPEPDFAVGGRVSGLPNDATVLVQSGASSLTLAANGAFALPSRFKSGATYSVAIAQSAVDRDCTVANASGTVNGADVSNIEVDCSQVIPWGTDGPVSASAVSDDGSLLYIGGDFTQVGRLTGGFVPVDVATGRALAFPAVNGVVNTSVSDGAGGWYLGGSFTKVGGSSRANLVHILANGGVDLTFNPQTTSEIRAMVLVGDRLIVNDFRNSSYPGRSGLTAVEAVTGKPTDWAPAFSLPQRMAVLNNLLFVADTSTPEGSSVAEGSLSAIDLTTGQTAWRIYLGLSNSTASIRALALNGDSLMVGGDFDSINGVNRRCLAAVNTASGAVSNWSSSFASTNGGCVVQTLMKQDTTLYVGGEFIKVGGLARQGAAAIKLSDGQPTAWDPVLSAGPYSEASVYAMAATGDEIVLSGNFSLAGSSSVNGLAMISRTNGNSRAWCLGGRQGVGSMQTSGDKIWLAGGMNVVCGQPRKSLAALNTSTGQLASWDPQAQFIGGGGGAPVQSMLISGSRVYVAGGFSQIGGSVRAGLAALDRTTGAALAFNPTFDNGKTIDGLAKAAGKLYIRGVFDSINGQARSNLAAFSISDDSLLPWAPQANPNSRATDLIATEDTVYLAGGMTIEGKSQWAISALDASTGQLQDWNPQVTNASGNPLSFARMGLVGNTLFLFGNIDRVEGSVRLGSVAFDLPSRSVLAWSPAVGNGSAVSVSLVRGSHLYLGLQIWDTTTQQLVQVPDSWGTTGDVSAISTFGGQLFIGGQFTELNGKPAANLSFSRAPS